MAEGKVEEPSKIKLLKEIVVPESYRDRHRLGVQVIDEMAGGQDLPGWFPGASIIFTGFPGAGKSTASLQLADLFASFTGLNVLYNVGEEHEYMVKLRADRLGVMGNFGMSVIEDTDELISACKESGVEVLFTDSLQTLQLSGDESKDLSEMARWKHIVKKLHKFAGASRTLTFIIAHITKGGDMAGPQEMKHDVDMHMHLMLNPMTQARELVFTKNRHGPAGIPWEMNMSAKGLDLAAAKQSDGKVSAMPGAGGSSGEKRRKADEAIKESLLKGEKVSRKCHSRLGIECSDQFFAARIEWVVQQLRANGHIVNEVQYDGRQHFVVEV
jgi:DNA repair protein RadA/Sms